MISVTSDCADVRAIVRHSRCSGVTSLSSTSSVMPRTPFIGVRISWLTLARNSLLAWLAASAASLADRRSAVCFDTRRRSRPTHPRVARVTTTRPAASVSVRCAVHHGGLVTTVMSSVDRR